MTSTAAKWSERVREWRASGETAGEFASGRDFEASTLRWWASRLKTGGSGKPGPYLARVVRRSSTSDAAMPARATRSELEVLIGAARIVVRGDFDPDLLRQVASALGSGR
jgi:hypothetical protein